jgi:hypothetical protein
MFNTKTGPIVPIIIIHAGMQKKKKNAVHYSSTTHGPQEINSA